MKPGQPEDKAATRRRREMLLAVAAVFLIIILTWAELRFMSVDSYLFLALFNLNFILLLLVLFIVLRNTVKLILERRRKVLGSMLRTKLVMAFITLSLIPTTLMFILSLKFVQTSVDYWFKNQVESSMEEALEVGQFFYATTQERMRTLGQAVTSELAGAGPAKTAKVLAAKKREYGLGLLGILKAGGEESSWLMDDSLAKAWPEAKRRVSARDAGRAPPFASSIVSTPDNDFVIATATLSDGSMLVLGQALGRGMAFKLDQIVRGIDDYKKLRNLKVPLKLALYLNLGVMALLIFLGAMWFGFRLAKELSTPLQALAEGTQRIARGDLSVRLEDNSDDELGQLVRSFNRMAEDLQLSQDSLTQANERLGRQNRELEERGGYILAVLNNITAGVVSLDSAERFSTVNRAAEAMLGLDGRAIMGRLVSELPQGEHFSFLAEAARQLNANPDTQWQRQIGLAFSGRELKLLVNMVALRSTEDGSPVGFVAVFEDITELEKMQRLAAWREVARRIAHEIKNPLTPIKLSAQRMQRKFGPQVEDPVFEQCTDLIVRQVEHLQQMVAEFSAFAKLPEVVLRPGDLTPLLKEAVALYSNSHSHIRWRLMVDGPLPEVDFDPEGMQHVLINLLTNASEALEQQPDPEVQVLASYEPEAGRVRIEVRDNGPGLKPEERSRMFEPYYSSKKGGTGLGLAIVKSIVSDHKGFIRVSSLKPRGTTFVILLRAVRLAA